MILSAPPYQVTQYRTSDGALHDSNDDALIHEQFLAVSKLLPSNSNDRKTIRAMLQVFELTPKSS